MSKETLDELSKEWSIRFGPLLFDEKCFRLIKVTSGY